MNISKFLAKVMGIYFIILSLSMLINMQQIISLIRDLINNIPLMFVTGCFTLILGLLLIASHNIWQWSWRLIITLVAWLIFLKGATIVLYPRGIDSITMLFVQNIYLTYIAAGFDLILGLILTYFGFKR